MRLAIIGTGTVAQKFGLGLAPIGPRVNVTTVVSRDPDKARAFAAALGIDTALTAVEEAVARPDVDAVYIATPPHVHAEQALAAIAAGKHVLVEKPIAMDATEARGIADAAHSAGVFCMEAMWTRFHPFVRALKSRLSAGEIGEIRAFHGALWGANDPAARASLFDPAQGGGALMHRGIYPLNLAHHFFGPIEDVAARATLGAGGVDEDVALTLSHGSGVLSSLRASIRVSGRSGFSIHGTSGTIEADPPIFRPYSARLTRTKPAGAGPGRLGALRENALLQGLYQRSRGPRAALSGLMGSRSTTRYAGNGYHYQVLEMLEAVGSGRVESEIMPLAASVAVMEAIDSARAQWSGETP